MPFPCYSWSGFYCFYHDPPYCPRFILVVGITGVRRYSLGGNFGQFYLLSCFTLPIVTHFGNDHNILYSVNMKRRACSGNATSSGVVLSTVIKHVSLVVYLVYIPRSSSTRQFYDEQKVRKYGDVACNAENSCRWGQRLRWFVVPFPSRP